MTDDTEKSVYGSKGRVGLIVPPGNFNIEPELGSLLPESMSLHPTRLPGRVFEDTSIGLKERLLGYNASLAQVSNSFGGGKPDVLCYGVTGSCYMLGPDGEEELLTAMKSGGVERTMTATRAISLLIKALGGRKIGLVAPYPAWLTEAGVAYWVASGFEIVAQSQVQGGVSIYGIKTSHVVTAVEKLKGTDIDVILCTGTGMATVPAIEKIGRSLGVPVISSNLSLGWWATTTLNIPDEEIKNPALKLVREWAVPQRSQITLPSNKEK